MKAARHQYESLVRAKKVLEHYDGLHSMDQKPDLMLTDLLVDLMHVAEVQGIDFRLACRTARGAVSADQMLLAEKGS